MWAMIEKLRMCAWSTRVIVARRRNRRCPAAGQALAVA
jgi:hypothetical protein